MDFDWTEAGGLTAGGKPFTERPGAAKTTPHYWKGFAPPCPLVPPIPPQFRYRQGWAMVRHQSGGAEAPATVAPIACHLQDGETVGDLAEGDNS